MNPSYDDIISLPHHISANHPQMPMIDRAAQFSPFSALVGYEEAIGETGRLTEQRREPDEQAKAELDRKIAFFRADPDAHPEITVEYFVPDERKEGGCYRKITSRLETIDLRNRVLVLADCVIQVKDIFSIRTGMEEE